jgi:hypothetical protein
MSSIHCVVKAPSLCAPLELEDFVCMVRASGEVTLDGLPERVRRAHSLAFLRSENCLIGVAGLKVPSENHRSEVALGSGATLPASNFQLELGWVFVIPSARGGKSLALCAPLIEAALGHGIYATSRSNNQPMHSTLAKLGFTRAGKSWPSGLNPEDLWLFIRHAAV